MKYILQNIILLYSFLILTSTPNCTAEDPVLDHPDDDEQCKWAKTPFLILSGGRSTQAVSLFTSFLFTPSLSLTARFLGQKYL